MWKANFLIVATFLVVTEGLKCNKCFYAEIDGVPGYSDGHDQAGFKFDGSCDWNKDVKSALSGVECTRVGNVDPVCLVWRLEDPDASEHLVLRSCYNQVGGVGENELNSCNKKGFIDFINGILNTEIQMFIISLITPTNNKTLINQELNLPTDVCSCKEDNCNSGACIEGNCDTDPPCVGDNCGGASAITFSLFMIAAAGSLLYCFS